MYFPFWPIFLLRLIYFLCWFSIQLVTLLSCFFSFSLLKYFLFFSCTWLLSCTCFLIRRIYFLLKCLILIVLLDRVLASFILLSFANIHCFIFSVFLVYFYCCWLSVFTCFVFLTTFSSHRRFLYLFLQSHFPSSFSFFLLFSFLICLSSLSLNTFVLA